MMLNKNIFRCHHDQDTDLYSSANPDGDAADDAQYSQNDTAAPGGGKDGDSSNIKRRREDSVGHEKVSASRYRSAYVATVA